MPQFWGGFTDDRLHTLEVDDGFGGFGSERKVRVPALFCTREEARREYKDVRKVEVRVVGKDRGRANTAA